jgi:polysaccharide deacetylase 2 family uncharacterized protein YibQ
MNARLNSLILTLIITLQSTQGFAKQPIQLAIVLDDIGNSQHDLQALKLPAEITFAILPYTPLSKKIAQLALKQDRELLLHVPMEAKSHNDKLGKGALMLNMQESEFKAELHKALHYLPDATGINNHMGSTLTEHATQMQWTMDVLNKEGLYFLDSRTTAQTIAESTAKILGIPALRRHVFLDNIKTNEAMEKQFQQAISIGESNISVVIIAHPYPETIQFLADKFKQVNTQIELVSLQELLPQSARLAMAKKRNERQPASNIIISQTVNNQTKQIQ